MKALIVAPAWIGDTVMAQPLFERLHQRYGHLPGGLALDALAAPWVAPVLERMPQIGRILDNPFAHGELNLGARYRLGRELATWGYQQVYVLPNSIKSALVPFFAGIPERIGFTGESRYGLLNRRHVLDKVALPQMAERFALLAQPAGEILQRPLSPPRLTVTAARQQATLSVLENSLPGLTAEARNGPPGLAETRTGPVAFCPGAEYGPAKRWPAAHFARLAEMLIGQGRTVWLFGSGKDRAIAEAILAALPAACRPACRNLCGATTLGQAVDLLAMAAQVVCNDSGLMHVAAALGRPLVALYGSSSPGFTPPLSDRARILSLQLKCSPCFKRVCPLGHTDCLQNLTPEQVATALATAGDGPA